MSEKRGMVIHYTDGTKVSFDFPQQIAETTNMMIRTDRILAQQYVVVEAEGCCSCIRLPTSNPISSTLRPLSSRIS